MATKTVRTKDGRYITVDTETGKEVGLFEGNLKFVKDAADAVGLTTLPSNLPRMFERLGEDLRNLPGDIGPNLVYSDEVDNKGRPLTLAQKANRDKALSNFMRGGKGGIYDTEGNAALEKFMRGGKGGIYDTKAKGSGSGKIIEVTGADGNPVRLDMNNPVDVERLQRIQAKVAPSSKPPAPNNPPTESLNGRDAAAPSDPNNTGAKGTQMGLSGGSISPEFTTNDFLNLLGRQGITMNNPFGNQPLPATPAGNAQQRLNPGKIVGSSTGASVKPGNSVEVDSVDAQAGDIAGRMETDRTLSPDDSTVDGDKATDWSVDQRKDEMMARRAAFLDRNNKGYGAVRAADAAMGLGRQAVPGGGERLMAMGEDGELVSVTQEGYDLRKRGEISAQDLLSQHLAEAPAKAVDIALNAGDADAVTEPSLSMFGSNDDAIPSVTETVIDGDDMTSTTYEGEDEVDDFFSNTRKNIQNN